MAKATKKAAKKTPAKKTAVKRGANSKPAPAPGPDLAAASVPQGLNEHQKETLKQMREKAGKLQPNYGGE